MGELYLYHFPRRQGDIGAYSNLSPLQKIGRILKTQSIEGSKKGLFANLKEYSIPNTVSFSGMDFMELERLVAQRSAYGIAFRISSNSLLSAKKVEYLPVSEIRKRNFTPEELPFIDLVRKETSEVIMGPHLSRTIPRYDFSWEKEYRIVADAWPFEKKDIAFITAATQEEATEIKRITGIDSFVAEVENKKFKEAVQPYLKRPNARVFMEPHIKIMINAHQELANAPLEEVISKMCEKLNDYKKSDEQTPARA